MTELKAKRTARVRDGGKCVLCMRPGAFTLHGHHIVPKHLYPELRADVNNIVTLCVGCHLGIVHGERISDGKDLQGRWSFFANLFQRYVWETRHGP